MDPLLLLAETFLIIHGKRAFSHGYSSFAHKRFAIETKRSFDLIRRRVVLRDLQRT